MKTKRLLAWFALLELLFGVAPPLRAGPGPGTNSAWAYRLIDGSFLIRDCPVCAGPIVPQPMRGTFNLRLLESNPLFARYALEDIAFEAGAGGGLEYRITGRGVYQIGGEVALRQDLELEVTIDDGFSSKLCYLTNTTPGVQRLWPVIEASAEQTNGTITQVYYLDLRAAPLRELWFSTVQGFHSAKGPGGALVAYGGGDLLASTGRAVKRSQELTGALGLPSGGPEPGLDAVDIVPGGEIVFSTGEDVFSPKLGLIRHGDVIFGKAGTVLANEDLLYPLTGRRPAPDLGLDAVQVGFDQAGLYQRFHFSTRSNMVIFQDPQPNIRIGRGDLLWSEWVLEQGGVLKRNAELLARFHPPMVVPDFGLDAVHVWPSGEIWFSTEDGFQDEVLGAIAAGDLLSDQGYVVYRNLELLGPFAPVEDLADFGLDALFIVSDALPPAPSPAPRFTRVGLDRAAGQVGMEWTGSGRVFQVEKAAEVGGPYLPASAILTETNFTDISNGSNAGFYRVRQW